MRRNRGHSWLNMAALLALLVAIVFDINTTMRLRTTESALADLRLQEQTLYEACRMITPKNDTISVGARL